MSRIWSALALKLGAKRVEIAHVQYYGWALKNRAQLMPTREQVERAVTAVETLRQRASRADRDRCRGAGLLRALPESLRRRLGTPLAQRHAVGQGAALPRGREHSGARILERARACARRHLGQFAGVHGVSRHRLDAGAVPLLPEARRRISAAAAARPSRSPAMRARPIRCAISRRATRWWRSLRKCAPISNTNTGADCYSPQLDLARRRLPAEHAAAAIEMRALALLARSPPAPTARRQSAPAVAPDRRAA